MRNRWAETRGSCPCRSPFVATLKRTRTQHRKQTSLPNNEKSKFPTAQNGPVKQWIMDISGMK